MVPPSSVKIPRVPTYLICEMRSFVYGAITLSRQAFQLVPLPLISSAFPRSLAATEGISIDFFSYRYLDVSVPCVNFLTLCIQIRILSVTQEWVSPFGHLRIKACLTAPRSFSQSTTSFIASGCQGIHHVRLFT
jgi:hypothetical protein